MIDQHNLAFALSNQLFAPKRVAGRIKERRRPWRRFAELSSIHHELSEEGIPLKMMPEYQEMYLSGEGSALY